MNPIVLAIVTAALGVLLGFLLTRRWHLPTAAEVADAVRQLGGSGSVTVFTGILAFIGINLVVASGAAASLIHDLMGRTPPLNPTDFWERVLDSMLIASGAFAGIGIGGKIGHRATAKPDVIEAEGRVEALKTVALAEVASTTPATDGRTTAADDPRRGVDDEGHAL